MGKGSGRIRQRSLKKAEEPGRCSREGKGSGGFASAQREAQDQQQERTVKQENGEKAVRRRAVSVCHEPNEGNFSKAGESTHRGKVHIPRHYITEPIPTNRKHAPVPDRALRARTPALPWPGGARGRGRPGRTRYAPINRTAGWHPYS